MAPQSYRIWERHNQDNDELLQSVLTKWLEALTENEALFKVNVYENKDLADTDLRQHRQRLYEILRDGEALSLAYIGLGMQIGQTEKFKAHVLFIDHKVKEVFSKLIEWHGPACAQPDIPETFKQSMQELSEGKIVDFEEPK